MRLLNNTERSMCDLLHMQQHQESKYQPQPRGAEKLNRGTSSVAAAAATPHHRSVWQAFYQLHAKRFHRSHKQTNYLPPYPAEQ